MLGGFKLSLGDDADNVELPRQKAAALLAILASPLGKPRSRQELVHLLWGESGEAAARNNLRQALFVIRKSIPQLTGLRVTTESVELCADSVSTDVREFETGSSEAKSADLARAIDIYNGEFLAGLDVRERAFEEWRAREAERLIEICLSTHERLMENYLESQRYSDAIWAATQCLRLDPFHEVAHETLVVAHVALGRLDVARRHYRNFSNVLSAELDVAPATSLRELVNTGQDARRNQFGSSSGVETTAIGAGLSDTSIAMVMRFQSKSEEAEHLADAIVPKIVGTLGGALPLPVLGAETTHGIDADALSQHLSAAKYSIQGGVRHLGTHWRVDYRIVETDTGCQLQFGSKDICGSNPFDSCEAVGKDIAAEAAIAIELRERKRMLIANKEPIDAWERSCHGMAILAQVSSLTVLDAQKVFREALEIAPNSARVLAGLSQAVVHEGISLVGRSREEAYGEGLELAHRAFELDRNDPFVNSSLGLAYHRMEQFDRALEPFQRALRTVPGNPEVAGWLGNLLSFMGMPEKGLPLIKFSLKSTDVVIPGAPRSYLQMRDYKSARDWSEMVISTHPECSWAYILLASSLGHLGQKGRAYHALQKCEAMHPGRVRAEFEAAPTQYGNPQDHYHVLEGIKLAGWN